MTDPAQSVGRSDRVNRTLLRVAALALLTLGVFVLYVADIDGKSIWWDESLSLYRAQHSVPYIVSGQIEFQGSVSTDLHPPLYFMLLRAFILLGGESDLLLRLPSAFFGTLLVPLLYALGTRLRSRRTGWFAAALGALSPFVLWYAQEARMYTMVTFLGAAALHCLLRTFQDRRWQWGLAFGLTATLALATQYLIALVLPVHLAMVYFLWPQRRSAGSLVKSSTRSRHTLVCVGLCLVIAAVAGILIVREALGLAFWPKAGREYIPLDQMLADAVHACMFGLTVTQSAGWPVDLLAVALFGLGLYQLARRPVPGACRLASWAGPILLLGTILSPILAMWAYSVVVGPLYMGSRYVIMVSPAFYLGVAVGLDYVAEKARWLVPVVLAVVVGGMGLANYHYFFAPEFATKEDHRSTARIIAANERVGDVILVTAPENMTAFLHYYDGEMPIIGVPSVAMSGGSDPEMIERDLSTVLDGPYERVWLAQCRTMFSDPDDLVTAWLDDHTTLLERTYLPSSGSTATVSAYRIESPVLGGLTTEEPAGTFGDALSLESISLRYLAHDGTVVNRPPDIGEQATSALAVAGRSITVLLTWRPQSALGAYKTSLRIVDGAGVIWAQRDEEPYAYWPTSEWPADTRIGQEQDVRIPAGMPPGDYGLELVVYDRETGQSLGYHDTRTGRDAAVLDLGCVRIEAGAGPVSRSTVVPDGVYRPLFSAVFGSDLGLWAWDMAPEVVTPGQLVHLSLYWDVRSSPDGDYDLLINWRDEAGTVWHSDRLSPTGVAYPTTAWREGQLLQGALRLTVPEDAPSGAHTLHLLVIDRNTGEPLPLRRGPLLWAGHDLRVGAVTAE